MDTPREIAIRRVHRAAIWGGLVAAVPLLPITSQVLTGIELRLGASIASTYKAPLGRLELVLAGVGLSMMGRGLKTLARGAGRRLPAPFGMLIRVAVAAGTIEALGHGLVFLYESKQSR